METSQLTGGRKAVSARQKNKNALQLLISSVAEFSHQATGPTDRCLCADGATKM
jgi:hypothetical protein